MDVQASTGQFFVFLMVITRFYIHPAALGHSSEQHEKVSRLCRCDLEKP